MAAQAPAVVLGFFRKNPKPQVVLGSKTGLDYTLIYVDIQEEKKILWSYILKKNM